MDGNMKDLKEKIRRFSQERDWEQFHTPKNLSMALSAEAGELLEHFLWIESKESFNIPPRKKEAVADEIGDVLLYLVNLADKLGIDPIEAAHHKLEKSALKYPTEKVRGKSLKYNEYET